MKKLADSALEMAAQWRRNNTESGGGGKANLSAERAKALEYLVNGELPDVSELLKQIEDGARDFLNLNDDTSTDRTTETSTANLCNGMAGGYRRAEEDGFGFTDDERSFLLLGYLYGTLVSPNQEAHRRFLEDLQELKAGPSKGGNHSAEAKKEEAKKKMQRAKKKYDGYVASGVPERKCAGEVAKDMGVDVRTVRRWREQGWKPKE